MSLVEQTDMGLGRRGLANPRVLGGKKEKTCFKNVVRGMHRQESLEYPKEKMREFDNRHAPRHSFNFVQLVMMAKSTHILTLLEVDDSLNPTLGLYDDTILANMNVV